MELYFDHQYSESDSNKNLALRYTDVEIVVLVQH